MANPEKPQLNLTLRITLAFGVVLGAFFIIALRLWYLQILRGDFFRDRSENNRLRTIYLPPPRGLILDRNGIMLAKTRPSFNVELIAEDCPDPKSTIARLSQLLAVDNNMLMERLKDHKRRRRFEARLLLKDVSRDTVAIVSAHKWELPGVIINVVPTRDYQFQSVAAHVIGYIREINKNQLENPKFAGYQMGDEVGQYGLEARWEKTLQGKRGVQNIIVNATGSKVKDFSFEPEKAGHNLTLTLDLKVQQAADLALQGKRGAIVAMDPRNGEILAMSSSPAFDPNIFTRDISTELWNELTTGKGKIL
ncbi:MAG: penicillin-binding protein 2, partial [SAR324 cluster bacterium]|nr:penicillin-binding protein 2 [SAR324 cluster bacterium]